MGLQQSLAPKKIFFFISASSMESLPMVGPPPARKQGTASKYKGGFYKLVRSFPQSFFFGPCLRSRRLGTIEVLGQQEKE